MPTADNLAQLWFEEVWNKKDASAIVALSTPDMKAFGADGVIRTREGFAEFHRLLLGAVPDLHVTCDQSLQCGDVIAVRTLAGTEVARGLANYSAAEARLIARKPSAQIEALLGYANEPELIHRTNLVLV